MTTETHAFVHDLLELLETRKDTLVIDADTHISDLEQLSGCLRERYQAHANYYHGRPISAEDLLAEMHLAEVDLALVWQNSAATTYTDDPEENFAALLAANRYVSEAAHKYPGKFIPGGWVDPKACQLEGALKMVDILVNDFGFALIKLHPAQSQCPIDSKPMQELARRIVGLGAIPTFHFGADTPFTSAAGLEKIASLYPNHPILAMHMGGGGASYTQADELYHQARELGLWRPNIRYALSAKRDTHIESDLISYQLAGEPFCNNLFCASDAPFGRMAWNFGGFRAVLRSLMDTQHHTDARVRNNPELFTPAAAQNYLGRNFAEFMIGAYRGLLEHQGVM